MMKIALICICVAALAMVASAHPEPKAHKYEIDYQVRDKPTHNFYGQRQWRDRDGTVHGEYYVFLPDGRTQTVTYTVCKKSGYQAKISYHKGVKPSWQH